MFPIYALTRMLPIRADITGRRLRPVLKLLDRTVPLKDIVCGPDKMALDSSHLSERLLFYFFHNIVRYYQHSPLFRYMQTKLNKHDLFLDIGANLGIYSYLAKKLGCEVYLFEPEPRHSAFLKRNSHLFDRVFDIALSDHEGECDFYVSGETNLGSSSLVLGSRGWEGSGYSHVVNVKVNRLDTVIDDEALDQIKLVKVDVEGAEEAVIEGMEGILQKKRMDIWCEVRGEKSDRNPGSYKGVRDRLARLGYAAYVYDGETMHAFSDQHIGKIFDLLFIAEKS